jgi:hypothetical protein
MEYYHRLKAAMEGQSILSADWRGAVTGLLSDARTMYRDRAAGQDKTVMDLLASAIAKSHLQRASDNMNADQSFYLRFVLPPPLDSVAYYAGVVRSAYAAGKRRADTALASVGIEKPIAGAVDDAVEQEFLVYLYAKVEAANAPDPYTRNGKLSRRWRQYARRVFDEFLCRRVGVKVQLSTGCP